MTPPPDLARLSSSEKDALILALLARVDVLAAEVAALRAENAALREQLNGPAKTSKNSSTAPSRDQKPTLPDKARGKHKGRPGVFRALAENPDRVVEAYAETCPHCQAGLSAADQPDAHCYDHIDLPPIRPDVTRVNRHRGMCPCCAKGFSAPVPAGLEPGSPFGENLQALILHLHVTQAISFERLVRLLDEVFGVTISEGAIANVMARAKKPLIDAAEAIGAEVRHAKVVASDETSARVKGKTWWQWVLMSSTAVYHVIADTRAARVATAFLQGAVPDIWVSDRYGGQAGHGRLRQFCLAHLLRDAEYAIDEGDCFFALPFKWLLLRAIAIGRQRDDLDDAKLERCRLDLRRRLNRLLKTQPAEPAGRRLWKAMQKDGDDLFRFVTRRDVPYTNNGCERALRPSVIFRKVTGCFRSAWGAALYAAAQSIIATGRLTSKSALQAIKDALHPIPPMIASPPG